MESRARKQALFDRLRRGLKGHEELPREVESVRAAMVWLVADPTGTFVLFAGLVVAFLVTRARGWTVVLHRASRLRGFDFALLSVMWLGAHLAIRSQWNWIWDAPTYRTMITEVAKSNGARGQSPYFSGAEGNYFSIGFHVQALAENVADRLVPRELEVPEGERDIRIEPMLPHAGEGASK